MFLTKSSERFSWDGMTRGSLIKIKKIVFSTIVAEMFSFMLARNPVTKARTFHLPELEKTIHIVFTLRKEVCSGSIHDLAHMPTQNCLADGAIQASAKADNHITAVTLFLEHLWNTKFSCLLVAELFGHKGEGSLLLEHSQDFFCTNLSKKNLVR